MGKVIAFANQKGGTGKTTTVMNVAGALADVGKKVLIIDADPQGNLSVGFGLALESLEITTYHVLVKGLDIRKAISNVRPDIDLIPANLELSLAEQELVKSLRREDKLKNALKKIRNNYDFILIDCPPALGMLTLNAFSAADSVIVPMETSFYSLIGLTQLLQTIEGMREELNPELEIEGVLATRFDQRTRQASEVLADAREKLEGHVRVFNTVIREAVVFREAPVESLTVWEYDPKHKASQDYKQFVTELLNG